MKILIIEDDETKIKWLSHFLEMEFANVIILIARSCHSGLTMLSQEAVDAIILDMTLPLFDETGAGGGGRKVQFGGEAILKEMVAEDMPQKVVVVSQHDYFTDLVSDINLNELGQRLKQEFDSKVVDVILYDSSEYSEESNEGWRGKLKNAINLIRNNEG